MGSRKLPAVVLRPPLGARLMNAVGGLALWFPAVWLVDEETLVPTWPGAVLLAGGAVLGWRGFRLRAECADGRVIVRGYLRDRTIPCADIGRVYRDHLFPSIDWTDDRGRDRSTPLRAFVMDPRWPSLHAHQDANLRRLAKYVTSHRR